jgi:Glutamine amidotransferases class-II
MITSSVSRFAPSQVLRRGSRRVAASSYSSLSRSSLVRPSSATNTLRSGNLPLWYSTERILQLRSGKPPSEQPKVLYDPKNEKENCGVGLIASLKSVPSRHVVDVADEMLVRMSHRGGCGCDPASGDGAGEYKSLGCLSALEKGFPLNFERQERIILIICFVFVSDRNSFGNARFFYEKSSQDTFWG